MSNTAKQLESYLDELLETTKEEYIEVSSKDLQEKFERSSEVELCHSMRKYMKPGDEVLSSTFKEHIPSVMIRYYKDKDINPTFRTVQTYIHEKYGVIVRSSWIEHVHKNKGHLSDQSTEHPCPPHHVHKIIEGLKYFDLM